MKTPLTLLISGICALLIPSAGAVPDSFIWVNVSVKVIVDPATGATPASMSDTVLRDSFTDMNRWMANNFRGYRLRLVDLDASQNFKRIGALNDTTGPGKWYTTDLKSAGPNFGNFEAAAKANKTLYGWNDNAVNIYFNNKYYSRAGFPSQNSGLIISSYDLIRYPATGPFAPTYEIAGNLLHEIGHHFELYHTFGGPSVTDTDDGIADTALDPNSFSSGRDETVVRNTIAQFNFSANFDQLTSAQQTLVDNTANNGMAYIQLFYDDPPQGKVLTDAERYGPTRFLFTELQMDKWADYANGDRISEVSGTTRFIDASVSLSGFGTSTSPIKTLATGIAAASNAGTDILLLRPGTYTAATLTKPMTLRATRTGAVTIQKP